MSKELDRLESLEAAAGIEAHGIERVPPDRRTHLRIFDNFTLWASANLVLSALALGTLATNIFKAGAVGQHCSDCAVQHFGYSTCRLLLYPWS